MTLIHAIVLGIVEGLSEFLPISSTGHLILASDLLKIPQTEAHKVFEVTIQLGAILAVVLLYWKELVSRLDLMLKVAVAFFPTGVLGFLLYKLVKGFFFSSLVAYTLIIGGIVFIVVETYLKKKGAQPGRGGTGLEDISYGKAFTIGLIQSISMIPGVSRSGATIVGGLLVGMERKAAAEFSFLLAIPTMFAATGYDIYKNYKVFSFGEWENIAVGFITSFIFAVIGIKALMKYISSHTFIPFGVYRIIVGLLFLFLI